MDAPPLLFLSLFLTTSALPLAFKYAPGSFNKNDKTLSQPWVPRETMALSLLLLTVFLKVLSAFNVMRLGIPSHSPFNPHNLIS